MRIPVTLTYYFSGRRFTVLVESEFRPRTVLGASLPQDAARMSDVFAVVFVLAVLQLITLVGVQQIEQLRTRLGVLGLVTIRVITAYWKRRVT